MGDKIHPHLADVTDIRFTWFVGVAAFLAERRAPCEHDWQKTDNWLIDLCQKCGAKRA